MADRRFQRWSDDWSGNANGTFPITLVRKWLADGNKLIAVDHGYPWCLVHWYMGQWNPGGFIRSKVAVVRDMINTHNGCSTSKCDIFHLPQLPYDIALHLSRHPVAISSLLTAGPLGWFPLPSGDVDLYSLAKEKSTTNMDQQLVFCSIFHLYSLSINCWTHISWLINQFSIDQPIWTNRWWTIPLAATPQVMALVPKNGS